MRKNETPDLEKVIAKRNMPKKWRKVNGQWIPWQQPEPSYPPNLTNHMRMEVRRLGRMNNINVDNK